MKVLLLIYALTVEGGVSLGPTWYYPNMDVCESVREVIMESNPPWTKQIKYWNAKCVVLNPKDFT